MRLGYKIIVGADIASHDIKEEIITLLTAKGYNVTNADTSGPEHGDFSDAAEVVAKGVQSGKYQKGSVVPVSVLQWQLTNLKECEVHSAMTLKEQFLQQLITTPTYYVQEAG